MKRKEISYIPYKNYEEKESVIKERNSVDGK